MFVFSFYSNLEKFSLSLITSKNEMEKCDMSKRNGEVRYVKTKWRSAICQTGSDQTGLKRLVKQMDKTNRFSSTRPR